MLGSYNLVFNEFTVHCMNCISQDPSINKSYIDENQGQKRERTGSFEEKASKIARSILERLETNRQDAIEQQASEALQGFKIQEYDAENDQSSDVYRAISAREVSVHERSVGVAYCWGYRLSMEDAYLIAGESFSVKEQIYPFDLFGVFDGHGGAGASNFMVKKILPFLKEALETHSREELTDEGIFRALKDCFITLDREYSSQEDGTTATVAVILNEKMWVANVGDSRTILIDKKGNTIQASEDAKPSMEKYKRKIEKLGGWVEKLPNDSARVNGILSVARAVGDKGIVGDGGKCCVSPNPKITCFSLADCEEGLLLLASDGLYEVASTNEVGQAIYAMVQEGLALQEMSRKLVYSAIMQDSGDNVTVIIVKL